MTANAIQDAPMLATSVKPMRLAIAIASVGRPEVLAEVAPHWLAQSRPADRVMVVAVSPSDVNDLADRFAGIEVTFAKKGLPAQRNAALDALADDADVVVFFDDDYVPSRFFLERLETLMAMRPDLAVITGQVLADGIIGPGLTYSEAAAIVAADDRVGTAPEYRVETVRNAYGCNMITHTRLGPQVRFDERLPLYAWLEDVDYSVRMGVHGPIVRCDALTGVHMGAKVGRTPGKRMGYSQVVNTAYLIGKRTMPIKDALLLTARNIGMNLWRSVSPEPWVDRRGRLHGNLLGLWDLVRGRADPARMLEL
jgi:hypothetical protein